MANITKQQAEETYEALIPIDHSDRNNMLEVGVNGRFYLIKRGIRVNVPKEVYDVLRFKNMTL